MKTPNFSKITVQSRVQCPSDVHMMHVIALLQVLIIQVSSILS